MEKTVAYSLLEVKAVDDEKRIIRGWATTPEADRVGDVVEPLGVKFKNPAPLLWMHDHSLPVGSVTFGKPTDKGVPFEATLPVVAEPSQLKARIDEAWQSVKAGLIRAVSIGFRPLEYSVIEDTGGLRFTRTEVYELSLVSVPANAGATINYVRSLDQAVRNAASGNQPKANSVKSSSGVSEKKITVKLNPKKENEMSIAEQIKQFKETLVSKNAKLEELAEVSATSGETFDEAQKEEFDTLSAEVKELEDHIKRLEVAEKAAMKSAKPVTEKSGSSDDAAANARKGVPATVKATEKLDKGIAFARYARVKGLAFTGQLGTRDESQIAQMLYPNDEPLIKSLVQKAAVPAANTLSATWASNLIIEGGGGFADFVEYLRERSLYGQISPRFRNLPFDTPVLVQGSGGTAQWVKEGDAKPLTQWTYTRTKLSPLKVAAIAAITKETLMRASVAADAFMRDELARAVGSRIDSTLISDTAAVADESPAGLLAGTAALTLGGDGTVAGIRCDIAQFLKAMSGNLLTVNGAFWVMPETVAIDLSMATNEVGAPAFPGITPTGGTLAGLPVFTSQYVPTDSDGPVVALIKGDEIFLGDEGGIIVNTSDQATLQMDSEPTQSSIGTPTATAGVSMFQTNSVAFLVERFVNWQKRRSTSVVWANVNWDACES